MNKIIAIIPFFLFCSAWASERCEDRAQTYVEIREDYKSLAALRADLTVAKAGLGALSGERYARENGRIKRMDLYGQMVFNHMGGAKGDKLYKRAYNECVAEDKEIADRQAKQEARAKAREAASTHKKPEVMANLSDLSASYAGRIRLRIKSHITFTDDGKDNPSVELEIHASPDGTIISRKLLSRSGNNEWDDAVLIAIDKTASLPRDEDGRVPSSLKVSFRPRD